MTPLAEGGNAVEITELLARTEIHQVLMRYCRGVDRGDLDLLRSVYHPGAIDRHGAFTGTGEDFATMLVASMDAAGGVGQHHITNVLIELTADGAGAEVESYFLAMHPYRLRDSDTADLALVGGRYLDRFELRDGRWAITERTVVLDWSRATIAGEGWPAGAAFLPGARGGADPSASWFRPG
jgi:hypothetical protein